MFEFASNHCLATDLPHLIQQFLEIRHLVQRIHLRPRDLSFLVDDESGALADTGYGRCIAQNAELPCDRGVREKIGAHRNIDAADVFLLPGYVAWDGINADVQDLGIQIRKLAPSRIEFRDLRRSGRSPIERMKSDKD